MEQQHPFDLINPKSKEFDYDEAAEQCYQWIITELAVSNCRCMYTRRLLKCTCVKSLSNEDEEDMARAIGNYMASWTTFPPHTRKELCHQWEKFALILKDSGGGKCIYNAPNCGIPDCGRKLLCRNALLRIFNIGYRKYANACEDPSKRHSNTGKKGSTSAKGKHMKEVYDSLHSFFCRTNK